MEDCSHENPFALQLCYCSATLPRPHFYFPSTSYYTGVNFVSAGAPNPSQCVCAQEWLPSIRRDTLHMRNPKFTARDVQTMLTVAGTVPERAVVVTMATGAIADVATTIRALQQARRVPQPISQSLLRHGECSTTTTIT
jgi:hypothetical protein